MYNIGVDAKEVGIQQCKRDLEGDAKRVKNKINKINIFIEPLKNFIVSPPFHIEKDTIKNLYALYSYSLFKKEFLDRSYEKILKLIEDE